MLKKLFLSMQSQLALAFMFSRVAGYVFFLLLLPGLTVKNHRDYLEETRFNAFAQQVQDHYARHQQLKDLQIIESATVLDGQGQPVVVLASTMALLDRRGKLITPLKGHQMGETPSPDDLKYVRTLSQNGQVFATAVQLKQPPGQPHTTDEKALLQSVYETVKVTLPLGLLVAFVGAIVIAHFLTLPLQRLTRSAQAVMRKEKIQQVPVTLQNEVADLTQAFNEMLKNLAQGEQQRRQMIADIAHDLGTPLTVVSGYVQGMKQGKFQPTQERLEIIHDELLLLQNLVSDLRTLSLADEGTLQLSVDEVPPARLVSGIQQAFSLRAEKAGVQLDAQFEKDLPAVPMDLERMRQVLGNLVSNSLNHTGKGGQIHLRASSTPDHLILEVQDNGKGIPEEKLPFIFDRFFRVDESRNHEQAGGSGLGLAIARSIVELHGGRIFAQSALGQGTTMQVLLPRG
ncbi:sensor histidine kinase [Deinococcus cellulosilyticus]|uniref:histidine kinase n=1 Tax=Deinococcus cellulosilyticus (strain DSM 18568 / NBRC 106333 / KACC 11606 / 5516J-15) TaxID=1223518 RepID=A0A511MYW1_DEIC1|nr:HAMP domain-containing sensor histidine kinase [Deinococcus cellulosilyticus]GEM45702.1 two-component sensor histidine kinase [Deinococcus cellulosilyticus NBRC 106333 = KACC 11606]